MKILLLLSSMALSSSALAQTASPISSERRAPAVPADSTQVGVKLGLSKVEQLGDPVSTYGIYADHAVADNLLVGAGLDYWNRSTGTLGTASAQVSDLAIGADAKYVFTNVKSAFKPYALAGLTAHRFAVKEAKNANDNQVQKLDTKYKDISTKAGVDYGAGATYRVQQAMDVIGEVRYRSLFDSNVELGQLAFTGGLAYSM